jgi:hypothetical protein
MYRLFIITGKSRYQNWIVSSLQEMYAKIYRIDSITRNVGVSLKIDSITRNVGVSLKIDSIIRNMRLIL